MSNDRKASYNAGGVAFATPSATLSRAGNTQQSYSIGVSSSF